MKMEILLTQLLNLCTASPNNLSRFRVPFESTAAASVAVNRRHGEGDNGKVGHVRREEGVLVLLPFLLGPIEPFHHGGWKAIGFESTKGKNGFLEA